MELYKSASWTVDRKRDDVKPMLANSDVTVGLCEETTGKLVAFARVLTDFTYKAFIYDVIVLPEHRNHGVGSQLMEALINHPKLRDVLHQDLYCLEALVPFYNKCQFEFLPEEFVVMRRTTR